MKWVVIFLDVIVVPYLLFGIVVWKNAFPDYIHSEYARRFTENGLDIALFVNAHPYIQFLRPPDCFLDILMKKQGDSHYDSLIEKYHFGRGVFGQDGCDKGHVEIPGIRVFRALNDSKFVSVFRKEQYHFDQDIFDLYPIVSGGRKYVLSIRFSAGDPDSPEKIDEDELSKSLLDYRQKVKCGVIVATRDGFFGSYAPENISRQMASEYFGDTANVHALYDVFEQLYFKPDCLDSLVEHYGKSEDN